MIIAYPNKFMSPGFALKLAHKPNCFGSLQLFAGNDTFLRTREAPVGVIIVTILYTGLFNRSKIIIVIISASVRHLPDQMLYHHFTYPLFLYTLVGLTISDPMGCSPNVAITFTPKF